MPALRNRALSLHVNEVPTELLKSLRVPVAVTVDHPCSNEGDNLAGDRDQGFFTVSV